MRAGGTGDAARNATRRHRGRVRKRCPPTASNRAEGCALQESEQVADLKSKLKRTLDAYRKQEQVRHARAGFERDQSALRAA